MKILVIHQYYLLPGMPGGSRFNEFARLWTEAGHEVTVVAGTLDYNTGKVPERYRGRWVTREQDGQVRVIRCHVPRTYSKSYAGRMWAFAGFTVSALTGVLLAERPDVVIATSPPLVASLPGWAASRLKGRTPWVFEIRDLWPESAITTGTLTENSPITRVLYALERFSCERADTINVLTPAFRENLLERGLARDENIVFVPNGADVALFQPGPADRALRDELGWGDRFVAMYAGAHGRANALGQLVDAAEALRHRDDVLIACVGDGNERAMHEAEAKRRGLKNLVFHGAQPKERMPSIVRAADVGMAVLQRNPTFKTVYPNKVFDYMACERPTLLAIDGVARKLVCDDAKAGVFVEPEDGAGIARAIEALAESPEERAAMGRRGRAWVLANATREGLAKRYLEELERIVRRTQKAANA
jgi:glycosyltransferase involved in cell wall biosynthesis